MSQICPGWLLSGNCQNVTKHRKTHRACQERTVTTRQKEVRLENPEGFFVFFLFPKKLMCEQRGTF